MGWQEAKSTMGAERVLLGPQASHQWMHDPKHLLFVLARYKHAARLIGGAEYVLELGAGEGIGAGILASGREWYCGADTDIEAVNVAIATSGSPQRLFLCADVLTWRPPILYDAVVSLDVIEHIQPDQTREFLAGAAGALNSSGVCVIGTPNGNAREYESAASRAGHINYFDGELLRINMIRHFRVVQMFGMNDEVLTTGFLPMCHYLMAVGIGPR